MIVDNKWKELGYVNEKISTKYKWKNYLTLS